MNPGDPVWVGTPEGVYAPLPGPRRSEAVVVGCGAAGLAALGRLHERGVQAMGLDAGRVGGGASGRNGGLLLAGAATFHHDTVARHGRARAAAIHALTLDELQRLATRHPRSVHRTGSVRLAVGAHELEDCDAHMEALRADGFPAEAYRGPEGRGILLPDDGVFQPWERCAAEAARLTADGVTIHEDTAVTAIVEGQVQTRHGAVQTDLVVVAVDGGSETVLPEIGDRVRTARAQMLATAPAGTGPLRGVYARYGYDYWRRTGDGRIALGGCRDRGGQAEWTNEAIPSAAVQSELERLLRTRFGEDIPITNRWAGLIGFTADRLPLIAEVRPQVVTCAGYSGTGNLIGPLAGRAVVDLALDGRSEVAATLTGAR